MIPGERIGRVFAAQARDGKAALVTYLCGGYPTVEASVAHALACVEGGADILEIGVPFSDPTADGAAIARASQLAIAAGSGLDAALRVVAAVRAASDVPIVLFGYYNPLFVRGDASAANAAADAGADALLVVDLPPEEDGSLREAAHARGLGLVPLVAPTSTEARLDGLATRNPLPPFVYAVSVAGVTGSAHADLAEASRRAAAVRDRVGAPCVVGFGVADANDATKAASLADGVVVGTALVRVVDEALREGLPIEAQAARVRAFVRALADAVHAPRIPASSPPVAG